MGAEVVNGWIKQSPMRPDLQRPFTYIPTYTLAKTIAIRLDEGIPIESALALLIPSNTSPKTAEAAIKSREDLAEVAHGMERLMGIYNGQALGSNGADLTAYRDALLTSFYPHPDERERVAREAPYDAQTVFPTSLPPGTPTGMRRVFLFYSGFASMINPQAGGRTGDELIISAPDRIVDAAEAFLRTSVMNSQNNTIFQEITPYAFARLSLAVYSLRAMYHAAVGGSL